MAGGRGNSRYSEGPLYSQNELRLAEAFLAAAGMASRSEDYVLGIRLYAGADGSTAVVYLDEAGCTPDQSGMMIISRNGRTETTSVWACAKKQDLATTRNPVLRFLKQYLT